jgi:hypothetical protein
MKKHNNILHILSAMTLIVFIVLAFGSDEEQDTPEYKSAKEKLEKEGIIPTEKEMKDQEYWTKNIVGKWLMEKTIDVKSSSEMKYQKEYKKAGDYVTFWRFADNGQKTKTSIYDYSIQNEPGGKQITNYRYLIQGKGFTVILNSGKKKERSTYFYYDILSLDKDKMVLLTKGSKIDKQDYQEQEKMKIYFSKAK